MTDIIPNAGNLGTTAYERLHAEINKANNITIPAMSAELAKTDEAIDRLQSALQGLILGTRNYLLNTGLRDNASSFTGLNNEVTRVTTKKTPSGNNCFYTKLADKTSKVWRGPMQEVTSGFSIGDTMTFSAWTYITDEVAEDEGLFVEVVGVTSDNSTRTFIVNKRADVKDVNKWVKYDMTFVVPANTVKIKCLSYVVKNGSWYTGDFKLERGNRSSDWSPNPTDIYNAINVAQSNIGHIKHVSSLSELQTTLNSALSGDLIYIKPGVYNVDRSFIIPDGVHIIGSGPNTCIFKCNNTSINNVFRNKLNGSEAGYHNVDIIIEGICFSGENTMHNITAIATAHASNIIIRHCEFKGFNSWPNIEFNGVNGGIIEQCIFRNYGISPSATNATEVIQLDYMGSNDQFPWTGKIDKTSCKDITIRDNVFDTIRTGSNGCIGCHSLDAVVQDVKIHHNVFDDVSCVYRLGGSRDIYLHHNTGDLVGTFLHLGFGTNNRKMVNINVCNNNIKGRLDFVGLDESANEKFINGNGASGCVDRIVVSNNFIDSFRGDTIALTGNRVIITSNVIRNSMRSSIYINGVQDFSVCSNVCVAWDEMVSDSKAIQYGGNSSVTTSYGVISGNKGTLLNKGYIDNATITEQANCNN